jgi:hypothetical protein
MLSLSEPDLLKGTSVRRRTVIRICSNREGSFPKGEEAPLMFRGNLKSPDLF